jgi:urease accessory protein
MVMVGGWAALLPVKAKWAGPATFVAAMIIGFALAGVGLNFGAEAVIFASLFGLPVLILIARRAPLAIQFVSVGLFGFAHGFAHGEDIGVSSITFAVGMVAATLVLHLLGMTLAKRLMAFSKASRIRIRRAENQIH